MYSLNAINGTCKVEIGNIHRAIQKLLNVGENIGKTNINTAEEKTPPENLMV